MRKTLFILILLALTFVWASAQQDEVLVLKNKILDLQNKGELDFVDFTLCSKIFGFAYYVPLPEPVVDRSGTLLVYYEPANVYTSQRNGLYELWYTQDMVLMDASGKVINEWKDILSFKYTAKKPVLDLFAENSIDLKGQLPPGKYKFKAILKDQLSGKTSTKTIDFEIR